jgi:phospholipase C
MVGGMTQPATPTRPLSRREFIGAGATAAAAMSIPASVARAAGQPRSSGLSRIEHIVVLTQENRSYDHYFGAYRRGQGFSDPHAITLPGGRDVFHQPDPSQPEGYLLPFHLDTERTAAANFGDVDHSWGRSHDVFNGGAYDGWIAAKGPLSMGYFTRNDMAFYYGLADAFTLCDRYHCSVLSSTNPNRMYLMSGTIDPAGRNGGPEINNSEPTPGFTWTTYPERLERAGVSWRVYQTPDNFDDNALAWFAQYQTAPTSSPLYQRGLRFNGLDAWIDDVRNDSLPSISWLVSSASFSEHPGTGAPARGFWLTSQLLQALGDNPRVWKKTAFILNYDENGGFFDHVPPPLPPPGTPDEFVGGLPIGLGIRVPMLMISPYSRGGGIVSDVYDHTSVLRLMEQRFGVEEPNISAWRRRTCGDLTACFDFEGGAHGMPQLPDVRNDVFRQFGSEGLRGPGVETLVHHPQVAPAQERRR